MSWERGRDTFDRWLIDGDSSLNTGNWMWLSASSFFYQYFRVYSPLTYGKKYDPEGKYVKHFLPILKVSQGLHAFPETHVNCFQNHPLYARSGDASELLLLTAQPAEDPSTLTKST